jgi:hypothetical protein
VLLSLRLVVAYGLMLVLEGLRDGAVIPDQVLDASGDPSGWLFIYERRVRQRVVKEVRAGGSSRNVSCRVSVGTGMSGWPMTFDRVCSLRLVSAPGACDSSRRALVRGGAMRHLRGCQVERAYTVATLTSPERGNG